MIAVTVMVALLLMLAAIALWVRHTYPHQEDELVAAIDHLLPQTQCAQCGYPGCRPYAEALARAETAPNLCPPGGAHLVTELVELLHIEDRMAPPQTAPAQIALIDESACIGCALCLPPCPVDAIAGANGYMHTVIAKDCTGCELCIPACPVDCISLETVVPNDPLEKTVLDDHLGCIRCGQCDAVCPVDLPAQALLHAVMNEAATHATGLGIDQCIECGLCDKACPSDIPLVAYFAQERKARTTLKASEEAKDNLKARYERHEERTIARAQAQQTQRAERLKRGRSW